MTSKENKQGLFDSLGRASVVGPVSYTHLDVYKRQSRRFFMSFPTLNIGDLIAKTPIVQGGMGVGISLSRLASAVANEGGIGVIAGAMIGMKEPDVASNPLEANLRALRREIEKAREATQGIIGVNIMVALTTFAEMVRTSIEAKADVIFSGAGLPMDLPKIFNETCERKRCV